MNVESLPLEFTIGLSTGYGPIRDVLRLQQEECDLTSSAICYQYDSTDG